jgi:hypothetical protein
MRAELVGPPAPALAPRDYWTCMCAQTSHSASSSSAAAPPLTIVLGSHLGAVAVFRGVAAVGEWSVRRAHARQVCVVEVLRQGHGDLLVASAAVDGAIFVGDAGARARTHTGGA